MEVLILLLEYSSYSRVLLPVRSSYVYFTWEILILMLYYSSSSTIIARMHTMDSVQCFA